MFKELNLEQEEYDKLKYFNLPNTDIVMVNFDNKQAMAKSGSSISTVIDECLFSLIVFGGSISLNFNDVILEINLKRDKQDILDEYWKLNYVKK